MTPVVTVGPGWSAMGTGLDPGGPAVADGPALLAEAARLLPQVATGGLLGVDVHTALFDAATVLGIGRSRWHRLALTDEAADMLTTYLMTAGETVTDRGRRTLRHWLRQQDVPSAQRWLTAAAAFWARELHDTVTPDTGGRWPR